MLCMFVLSLLLALVPAVVVEIVAGADFLLVLVLMIVFSSLWLFVFAAVVVVVDAVAVVAAAVIGSSVYSGSFHSLLLH